MIRRDSPWAIMTPVNDRIRLAMIFSILGGMANLGALGLVALALASLISAPEEAPWTFLCGALVCTVGSYALRIASFNTSHYAAYHLETLLRMQLANHLGQIPLGRIQDFGAGTLTKVLHDDVRALHVFVADSTPLYARAYAMPLATFAVLVWLDWRLAVAAICVLVCGFGVLALAMRNFPEMVRRYNDAREQVSAAVIEFVQAMPVVRTFDTGHSTFGRFQRALDAYLAVVTEWYRGAGFSARFSLSVLGPLPTLLVLLWMGTWLVFRDTLDISTWLATLLIGVGMAEAMMPMMTLNHMVDKTKLSIARIREVLDEKTLPEPATPPGPAVADASVAFEHVSFGYEDGSVALDDVTFHVAPGTVTALVGPSGAGKTTVARLIARFWDVGEGRVRIGGVDIREMETDALMGQIAMVFQDAFLFAGSVADNIRLGSEQATLDEVIEAAKIARAHEFITQLPKGYDTLAGDRGVLLSGGQRQRITIARAVLQNRPILVLDEATAFTDPENEAALIDALSSLMQGRTVIMVAHRLTTVRDANQILVFEAGRLAEAADHDALIEKGGVYARLWTSGDAARNWAVGGVQEAGPE